MPNLRAAICSVGSSAASPTAGAARFRAELGHDARRCGNRRRNGVDVLLERGHSRPVRVGLVRELQHVVQKIAPRIHEVELALQLRSLRLQLGTLLGLRGGELPLRGCDFRLNARPARFQIALVSLQSLRRARLRRARRLAAAPPRYSGAPCSRAQARTPARRRGLRPAGWHTGSASRSAAWRIAAGCRAFGTSPPSRPRMRTTWSPVMTARAVERRRGLRAPRPAHGSTSPGSAKDRSGRFARAWCQQPAGRTANGTRIRIRCSRPSSVRAHGA